MMYSLLAWMVAAPLPLKEKGPNGPPPTVSMISTQADGTPVILLSRTVFKNMEQTVTALEGDKVVSRKRLVSVPVTEQVPVVVDGKQVQVYGVDGKMIDPNDLKRRIVGTMPVFVSADGKPVDPFHLRLAKEGTLILVIPPSVPGVRAIPPEPIPMPLPPPPPKQ